MSNFKHWMRNKLIGISRTTQDDSKASKDNQPWRLPVLPELRPRDLTPASSHESLLPNYNTQNAFFKKLPLELRQYVYKAAFGGRTVHIELRFDHPARADPTHAHDYVHAGLDPDNRRDRSISPAWIWWSCVCHRNPALEACADRCRSGSTPNTACFLYPWVMPGKCFIGAMGWLLTCRQA